MDITPRLYDIEASAAYLSLSPDTIYEYVRIGVLPRVELPPLPGRKGKKLDKILIDKQDLDIFIDHGKHLQEGLNVLDKVLQEGSTLPRVSRHEGQSRSQGKSSKERIRSNSGSFVERWKATL